MSDDPLKYIEPPSKQPANDQGLPDSLSTLKAGGGAKPVESGVGISSNFDTRSLQISPADTTATAEPKQQPAVRPPEGKILPRQDLTGLAQQTFGVPPHVAEAITDSIMRESGGNPMAYNPDDRGSPSGGLFQHHADRLKALQAFAAQQGKAWTDPYVQFAFAKQELLGRDPQAAAHFKELQAAPDKATAQAIWDKYFERGVAQGGGGLGDAEGRAMVEAQRRATSDYGTAVEAFLKQANAADPGSKERIEFLHKAMERSEKLQTDYERISKAPPKAQSPFESMSEWTPLMIGLLSMAGTFTRRPALGAINAASSALGALKQGNDEQYKNSMDLWDKQSSHAQEAFKMQNEILKEVMDDRRLSETERQNAFRDKLLELGLIQQAKQMDVEGAKMAYDRVIKAGELADTHELKRSEIAKNLRGSPTEQKEVEVQQAAKADDEAWLKEHPEAKTVPQDVHFDHYTKRLSETTARGSTPQGVALKKFLEENPDASSAEINSFIERSKVARSGQAAAVRKFMEENPNATADDIVKFNAHQARAIATERAFGAGFEARSVTSMNTVADHLAILTDVATALDNGNVQRLNTLKNALRTEFGLVQPVNFELARQIAGDEIARAVIGGVGGTTDRDQIKETISKSQSPAQLASNIALAKRFIAGRLNALKLQYAGHDPEKQQTFNDALSEEARKEIDQLSPNAEVGTGILPAGIPPGSKKIGTSGGKDVYQAPDGSKWQP